MEERGALLRVLFQCLCLGETELANSLLHCLHQTDAEACRQLLQQVLQLPSLSFDFVGLESHQLSRIQWSLATSIVYSDHPLDRLLVLKAELHVIADCMWSDGDGQMTQNDTTAIREAVDVLCEKLLPTQRTGRRRSLDSSSLQSALSRVARSRPGMLNAFVCAIDTCELQPPVPKEVMQFLSSIDKSAVAALDVAVRNGRMNEAYAIVQSIQFKVRTEGDYQRSLKNLVQHAPLASYSNVLPQSVLSNPSIALSTALQRELDAALLCSDDAPKPKELFFRAEGSDRQSVGFQNARVHDWHVEGMKLETVLKEIGMGKFEVLENWKPGNRRLLALAVLMGWDMLSAQNTASTFPLKKRLLENTFPRLASGLKSEFSGSVASLFAKLQFSELLSASLPGCEAGTVLTQLQSSTPQQILSQHADQLNTEFIVALANLMSLVTLDVQTPVIRDLQMVLSSGVISSVLAFLTVTADVFNGHGQIPGQEMWLSELSDLIASVHACLCSMHGTLHHIWTLSIVNCIIQLFTAQPDIFKDLDVMFVPDKNNRSAATASVTSGAETLKLLKGMVDVLQKSAERIEPDPDPDCWTSKVLQAHIASFDDFYGKLQCALGFLVYTGSKNVWKFLSRGNWKEVGAFLSLPCELHQLLASQTSRFQGDVDVLILASERLVQRGIVPEPRPPMSTLPAIVDIVASRKLNPDLTIQLLNLAIQCITSAHEMSTDPVEALQRETTHRVAQRLLSVLEATKDSNQPDHSVAELFSKGVPSRASQLLKTSNGVHVRKVLEQVKAITSLRDALRDLRRGRLRYLSGLLHNLSRALSEDMSQVDMGAFMEIAGLGPDLNAPEGSSDATPTVSYLSKMIRYLAEVGDIISTMDDGPTEGHNYFAMLHQTPQDLLSTLIGNSLCAEDVVHSTAVAEVLGVDLAHEVLTNWLTPLYPPADSSCEITASVINEELRMPTMEAMKELINLAPVRVMVACAFASLQKHKDAAEKKHLAQADEQCIVTEASIYEGRKPEPVIGCLALAFEARDDPQFPVLQNWVDKQQRHIAQDPNSAENQTVVVDKNEARARIANLLENGSGLREALKLADGAFESHPPDELLLEIVEATERFPQEDEPDGFFFADKNQDQDPLDSVPISWVACLKMENKKLAFEAASRRVHSWSLERAIEFYSLQESPLSKEYLKRLKLYQKILLSPLAAEFHDWVEVDTLYATECGQLVRRLLGSGAADFALEVAHSTQVPQNIRCEVHAAHVDELGRGSVSKGKGPMAAVRFLKSVSATEAFEAGIKVLTSSSCPLSLSRLLVHYLMSIKASLPAKSAVQLEQTKLGIAALRCLPQQWSEKCAHLVETPSLIIESLVMAQQTVSLKKMMEEVRSLRDDSLLIFYARKALGLGVDVEALPFFMEKSGESPTSSMRSEASQVNAPQQLSSRFVSSVAEPRLGMGLVPMSVLSGVPQADEQQRSQHSFRGMPNLTLFRVLLDLLSSSEASGAAASRTAADLAETHLTRSYGELEWNATVAQGLQEYVDVCLNVLDYTESKLRPGESTTGLHPERSSETSASRVGSDSALRLEVELLQKLLTAGIRASLIDLQDQQRCEALLHRLVTAEQYHLAVQTARQCSMDERPYWEAWVIASIQEGNFISARERVPYVFCIPSGVTMDTSRMRMESRQAAVRLVRVLEMASPVDLPAFFALHNCLKQSRLGISFRASASDIVRFVRGCDSPDSGVPSSLESLGLSEKMKRKDMIGVAASSTLLAERVQFCEELLATYAPSLLIPFMFRHGRGDIACQVMYPVGMDEDIGTFARTSRRRERAASDRVGLALPGSPRERAGGSSLSSALSEMAGGSDLPSPRPVSFQLSSSRLYRTRSPSSGLGEASSSRVDDGGVPRKQKSLPGDLRSASSSIRVPPLGDKYPNADRLTNDVDPHVLAREVENVDLICDLSVRYMHVEDMVHAMLAGGSRGKRALAEACTWLENAEHYHHLYSCQKALNRIDAAGETCIRLSWICCTGDASIEFLELAKLHFQEALSVLQRHREAIEQMPVMRTQAELSTLIARVTLQLLINKELFSNPQSSGDESGWSPRECTMFTEADAPTEEDTARQMRILERLLSKDFGLAFRVIFEFRLSEVEVYSHAAASMSLSRKHKAILDLVNNIKGTVSDQQLDQILYHAVSAYAAPSARLEDAEWTDWFAEGFTFWLAEGLIELMASPHAKVQAFVKLSNVEAAYKLAALHGAPGDLNIVMEAAQRSGHRSIVRNCEQILGRARIRTGT